MIQFRFDQPMSENQIARFLKALRADYPQSKEIRRVQFKVNTEAGEIEKTDDPNQHRLANEEENRLVIVGHDSILVSHLAPYGGWEELERAAEFAWKTSRKIAGVRKLVRYGVRYINRLDLPLDSDGSVDYEEYLALRIRLPEDFDSLNAYEIKFSFDMHDIQAAGTVSSKVAEQVIIDHGAFYLDIDISSTYNLPQNYDDLISKLREVRLKKNNLFEQFITDKAREIFNGE